MFINTKIKTNFLILLPLFLIIFNGCSKESKYSQDGSSFRFINYIQKCETSIELDRSHQFIETIYSSCQNKLNVTERIEDIKKTITYFNLENKFKKSNIIKITFLKNGITFPNLLKYIKEDKKWNKNIFLYDKTATVQHISNKFYQEIGLYINNSNVYLDIERKFTLEKCNLKLSTQYYLEDKTLYTIPKVYTNQLLVNAHLFSIETYNNDLPAIDYLPFKVSCQD